MDKAALLTARSQLLPSNYSLSYSKNPLLILRAEGQYLFDEEGCAHLDCVNNVAHVGHCHPAVVAAATEELALLQSNTRYLSPHITAYAEALRALLPSPLSVVFFCNSGSEANDLALRLAREHTKRRGVIAVDGGYHGHTGTLIDISPYKFNRQGGRGRRSWVRVVPCPDPDSGLHRGSVDDDALGEQYAAYVTEALESMCRQADVEQAARQRWKEVQQKEEQERLEAAGKAGSSCLSPLSCPEEHPLFAEEDGLTAHCGAFIMEPLLSCAGQVLPPKGFLRRAYAAVRAAGGLVISDEVQTGFGRAGRCFWGFQLHAEEGQIEETVVPDILTLGKAMGNGFPLAAVVTTRAIADSFAAGGMEFFNTFAGGGPACRAGLAMLQVLQKEGLQQQALAVGELLLAGLRKLQSRHSCIGSVRGVGLMIGLELVRPVQTEEKGEEAGGAAAASTETAAGAGSAGSAACVGVREEKRAWPEAAAAVCYALRARRILLSSDGMQGNVLKIKPPMVFSAENAGELCTALDEALQGLHTETLPRYSALMGAGTGMPVTEETAGKGTAAGIGGEAGPASTAEADAAAGHASAAVAAAEAHSHHPFLGADES